MPLALESSLRREYRSETDLLSSSSTFDSLAKALELFMQSILDEMVKHARVKGARKLTPTYL
jgi:hypothetical protein